MNKKERKQHQDRMRKQVAFIQGYMAGYHKQHCYEDYSDQTFIDDVLYGLGIALDQDAYQYADGYRKFKDRLREHLREPAVAPFTACTAMMTDPELQKTFPSQSAALGDRKEIE